MSASVCVCGKQDCSISFGLCHCGCGESTDLVTSKEACSKRNWRVGFPKQYIHNHHMRKSAAPYLVENRGYKTPCWIWQRSITRKGYGMTERHSSHVVYYERAYGRVPIGLQLDHLCRQRACCNPDHLEPVTNAVNQQRGMKAKITPERVIELRRRLGAGEKRLALKVEFGISRAMLDQIMYRKTWRNV